MTRALIQVASWEDRFLAGFGASIDQGDLNLAVCIGSIRYKSRTEANRAKLEALASIHCVRLEKIFLDFGDVVDVIAGIQKCLDQIAQAGIVEIVFDISTAPRHIIWGLLSALSVKHDHVWLRYVRARHYGDWQTDEDQDPRLVVNCSGIMYPDLPTCLLMMCGPEISRAERMLYRFEPRQTIILRDTQASFYGHVQSFDYPAREGIQEFLFDNKDLTEDNLRRLINHVEPLRGKFNIVCASFGPKLGAINLFKLIQHFPEIALAYVPAGIHNLHLSSGIDCVEDIALSLNVGSPNSAW